MPVEFTCDGCSRRLRAPDAKAGKRVNCPTCGKDLLIPVMSTPAPLSLPTAGEPIPNPLDKLSINIPSAAEAAAGFQLSAPQNAPSLDLAPLSTPFDLAPPTTAPKPVAKPAANLAAKPAVPQSDIGLASDASSANASGSGIGGGIKSKSNAWRGGEVNPATPSTPAAAVPAATPKPAPPGSASPKPAMPGAPSAMPAVPKPGAPEPGAPKATAPTPAAPKPAAPNPAAPRPAMPTMAAPTMPALNLPAAKPTQPAPPAAPTLGLSIPMASDLGSEGLTLVEAAPTQPNPLDDIFKDLPQLAPLAPQQAPLITTGGGSPFGNLRPVGVADPFASQGAALPQASAPRWDQIASSANVGASNPYAAPSASASGGGFRRQTNIDSVRTTVMIPAVFLLIGYIINMLGCLAQIGLYGLAMVVVFSEARADQDAAVGVVAYFIGAIVAFVLSVVGLVGSIKMMRIKSHGMAMAAAVMSIFPFCLCSPLGIWAVIVLSMDNVKRAFEANERRSSNW